MIPWFKRNDFVKKIFFFENSCCSPELLNLFSSKYDPQRLRFERTDNIHDADILFINGFTSEILLKKIETMYDSLKDKPEIIAFGGCAINEGPLNSLNTNLPITIYIPGCPPRPESIINGLLKGIS
jgi:NADH-quinone oxidoreductase subunit B